MWPFQMEMEMWEEHEKELSKGVINEGVVVREGMMEGGEEVVQCLPWRLRLLMQLIH